MQTWKSRICVVLVALTMFVSVSSFGADKLKKYQVTGKVLGFSDDIITIEKGDEKWELVRNKDTKIDGKLAVGEKVTIEYVMVAEKVDKK